MKVDFYISVSINIYKWIKSIYMMFALLCRKNEGLFLFRYEVILSYLLIKMVETQYKKDTTDDFSFLST